MAGMSGLDGKVALVTGSNRGIGAAIAARLARDGAKVAVHGRDAAAAEAVRGQITQAGGTAIQVIADLTDFAAIEAMRADVERELGPIDVLVANAGHNPVPPGPVEEISEQGWRDSIDANLTATFLTLKSVLPGMKERHSGTIVTISSAAGRRPHPRSPVPYAVAKAGIQLLTQDVAAQAGPFGVRANCVAPETIMTERNAQQIPAAIQEALVSEHPIRRLGTPQDVAAAVAFLASDESTWITGVVIDIAGGAVMLT
jgi:3-oxoacyl-[acyl-carrier protein] reductase